MLANNFFFILLSSFLLSTLMRITFLRMIFRRKIASVPCWYGGFFDFPSVNFSSVGFQPIFMAAVTQAD